MIMIGSVNVWLAVAVVVVIQVVKEAFGRGLGKLLPGAAWLWLSVLAAVVCAIITGPWPISRAFVGDAVIYLALILLMYRVGIRGLEPLIRQVIPAFTWTRGTDPGQGKNKEG